MEDPTLKELRHGRWIANPSQLLQSCEESVQAFLSPGFQSKPWAGISQRFQRFESNPGLEVAKRFERIQRS
jgi:hypothetical protein